MQHVDGQDGLRLALTVIGDGRGPAVVLLHGGGQTRHAWGNCARRLAEHGFRVAALDSRGHGDSGWSPCGDYSMSAQIGDVEAVSGHLGSPIAIVGASMGGQIGLCTTSALPNLVRALVLVDVTPRVDREGRARVIGFMKSHPDPSPRPGRWGYSAPAEA